MDEDNSLFFVQIPTSLPFIPKEVPKNEDEDEDEQEKEKKKSNLNHVPR